MSRIAFRFCLVCLLLAAATLSLALMDWNNAPASPIGGGSYDLGGFVYSWALVLFSGIASMFSFVAGLNSENRSKSRRAFAFAAIALLLLATSIILHGANLQ